MSHARALELVGLLELAGVDASTDPRTVPVPGVLITPPGREFDLGCGFTARWQLVALAPGSAGADTWHALDELVTATSSALPIETAEPVSYQLRPGTDLPAYLLTFTEGHP